ncbi:MAG: DUF4339 domain-containing protein [Candidatus Hydrogenedentota bacterium]|nr:MAG: DUF4339 domain-containing protein [Candidatus Hydrogenedentota bacterium]
MGGDEKIWFVHTDAGNQGPYSLGALKMMLDEGQFTVEHHVWREGMENWKKIGNVPELAALLPSSPVSAGAVVSSASPAFVAGAGEELILKKQFFKLFGAAFRFYDTDGNLVLYGKQKAFKLKEDIRVFADEDQKREVFNIQAQQVIDFSAAYDVIDSTTNEKVGGYRRKGMKSMLRDEWEILDASGNPIGKIQEDSMGLALIRRFMTNLIPQGYTFTINNQEAATLKQSFNPFVYHAKLTIRPGFDSRLIKAGAVLLLTIEGRQR